MEHDLEYAPGDELSDADVLDTINYFVHVDSSTRGEPTCYEPALATPTDSSSSSSGGDGDGDESGDADHSRSSSPLTADGDDSGDALELLGAVGRRAGGKATAITTAAASGAYKNSQKQELAYLKTKVRELELELRRVVQANDAKLALDGDSLWQRVAQQQSIERQKALSENARLKAQLEEQLKFSKSLEKIIRKRPNLTAFGASYPPFERRKRRSALSEKTLHERLITSAECEFARTDAVLHDIGANAVWTDQRDVSIRLCKAPSGGPAESIRVESLEVRRFPFPFRSVAREWWAFIAQGSHLEQLIDGMSRKVESTSDAHLATTSMQFPVGEQVGVLNATAAIRRFDEEDRTVFTYVSHGDCATKRNPKGKFAVVETGWIRVMPLPGRPESCILHSASYFTPTHCCAVKHGPEDAGSSDSDERGDACVEHSAEAGILSEVIYSVYQKTTSYIYSVIENALMKEHLERRGAGPSGASSADFGAADLDTRAPAAF